MTQSITTTDRKSIVATMAQRYQMEPQAFEQTLRNTVAKPARDGREMTREEFAACLVVANEYNLNPLTKEIYFFPDPKRGGIVPVLGVDGWARIINEHKSFDGMDFVTEWASNGKPFSVECRMFRKDRSHPVSVIEYFSECARDTDPWKKSPARMLRHKAMIQAARYAFGFSGLHDEDDADFIVNGTEPKIVNAVRRPSPPPAPQTIEQEIPEHMRESEGAEPEIWDEPDNAAKIDPPVEINTVLETARSKAMNGTKALKLYLAKLAAADAAKIVDHLESLNAVAEQADSAT